MTDVMTYQQEALEKALKEIPNYIGISGGWPGPAMVADGKLHEALFYLNAELVLTKFRRLMNVADFNEYDIVNTPKSAAPLELRDVKKNMYEGEYLVWYVPPQSSLDTPWWQLWIKPKEPNEMARRDTKKLLTESGLLDGWDGEAEEFENAYTCIGSVNVL